MPFFNYSIHSREAGGASFWDRRAFLKAWGSLYSDDSRWTPPDYGRLRRELDPRQNEHLARLEAALITIDALHRTGVNRSRTDQQEIPLTSVFERILVAAVAVIDPRRKGKTAHLALPHFAFDKEAFDILYYHLVETLSARGYHRVIAPVGLSPHLGSGLLIDSWDEWPPLHTPSNPPYLPELIESRFRPLQEGRLYHVVLPEHLPERSSSPAAVHSFDPSRLTNELLPLLAGATEGLTAAGFPPPDAAEASFILRMLEPEKLMGLLAEIDGEAAGFVLAGPDHAGRPGATAGNRLLGQRGLLAIKGRLAGADRVGGGRVYFAGVLPAWRRRGIGAQLWEELLLRARGNGWQTLTIGPIYPANGVSAAETFLARRGAMARQTYRLYERSF